MKATAKLMYLRIAPRKVRMVSDLVRGKNVEDAQDILSFAIKKGALPILKLLRSAIASAKKNFNGQENNLFISHIAVDEGPKLKRVMAMSRGQAYPMFKRTSHITIVLDERIPTVAQLKKTETEPVKTAEKQAEATPTGKSQEPAKMKAAPQIQKKVAAQKQVRGIQRIFRRKAI